MCLWTCRLQFWQRCRDFFAKTPKLFRAIPNISCNFFFWNLSLPKCSSGQVECKLDNPDKSLSLNVQYFQLRSIFSREFLAIEVSKRWNFGQIELRCHMIDRLLLHAGLKIASNSHKLNLATTFFPIQISVVVQSFTRFVCETNLGIEQVSSTLPKLLSYYKVFVPTEVAPIYLNFAQAQVRDSVLSYTKF